MTKKIKHFKRWLALLLAVVLVAGTCVYSNSGSLWATEGVTPASEENAPADESNNSSESEPQVIVIPDENDETDESKLQSSDEAEIDTSGEEKQTETESGAEGTTPEAVDEEDSTKEEAALPETEKEKPEEEIQPELPKEELIEKPEQTMTVTADDGAIITVFAPEGAIPKDSKVIVKIVSASSDLKETIKDSAKAEGKELVDLKVYDITIMDAEGREIQPDETVQVTIKGAELEGEDFSVYHVEENDNVKKVTDVESGNKAEFDAEHFSQYPYVGTKDISEEDSDEEEVPTIPEEEQEGKEALKIYGIAVTAQYTTMVVGEEAEARVRIELSEDGSDYRNEGVAVQWSSSNEEIATVSEKDGKTMIKALASGNVTITAVSEDDPRFSSSVDIHISDNTVTSVKIVGDRDSYSWYTPGNTATLHAEVVYAANADESKPTTVWSSSDEAVAAISENPDGTVTVNAKKEGIAVITATAGDKSDTWTMQISGVLKAFSINYWVTNQEQNVSDRTINVPVNESGANILELVPGELVESDEGRTIVFTGDVRYGDLQGVDQKEILARLNNFPVIKALRYWNGQLQYQGERSNNWETVDISKIHARYYIVLPGDMVVGDETGLSVNVADWPYANNSWSIQNQNKKTLRVIVKNDETGNEIYNRLMRYDNSSEDEARGKIKFDVDESRYKVGNIKLYKGSDGADTSINNAYELSIDLQKALKDGITVSFTNNQQKENYIAIVSIKAKEYSVEYDLAGGNGNIPQKEAYKVIKGTQITIGANPGEAPVENPTKNGYVFGGWICSYDNNVYQSGRSMEMPLEDVTFTAKWVPVVRMISYMVNDPVMGSVSPTQESYSVDKAPTGSTATANAGYKFVGWYKDENRVSEVNQYVPDAHVATYVAHFEKDEGAKKILSYTVEYYKESMTGSGYEKVDEDSYKESEELWVNEKVLKVKRNIDCSSTKYEGYTLNTTQSKIIIDGNETDFNASSIPVAGQNIKDGTVIKLYYDRNDQKYTVHYLIDGTENVVPGEKAETKDAKFGDVINENTPGIKKTISNYTFVKVAPTVLNIGAEDAKNVINVYYRANKAVYTIRYHYSTDGETFAEATDKKEEKEGNVGDPIPYTEEGKSSYNGKNYILADKERDDRAGTVYGTPGGKITSNPSQNTIDVYYILDANGEEGKPDDIPDYLEHHVYYKKDATGEVVEDTKIYPATARVAVKANPFTKEGATFAYWLADDLSIGNKGIVEGIEGTTFTMPDKAVTLTAQWRSLTVTKTAAEPPEDRENPDAPRNYKLGDTIKFDIVVSNTGDVELTDVIVTDTLSKVKIDRVIDENEQNVDASIAEDSTLATISSLGAGKTVTVKASYVVAEKDLGRADFTNTARAESDGVKGTGTTDPIPMDEVDKQLTITKTIRRDADGNPVGATGEDANGNPVFTTGDTVTFDIIVENTGNQTLKNIVLKEALKDAELENNNVFVNFWSKLFTGITKNVDGTTIDELKPGKANAKTFESTYKIKESDLGWHFRNMVTTEADGVEVTPGTSEEIPVEEPNKDFNLEKTLQGNPSGSEDKYKADDEITYTITVANTGNVTLENFVVSDSMFAEEQGKSSVDITDRIINPSLTVVDKNGTTVTSSSLKWGEKKFTITEIPGGGTATITYTYKVQAEDAGKTIKNIATAEDDKTAQPDTPVVVEKRALEVVKTIANITRGTSVITGDQLAKEEGKIGDVVNYTVTVTNTGNVALENVALTDAMADGRVAEPEEGQNSTFTLAVGGSETLRYSYTIKESDLGKSFNNTATAKIGDDELGKASSPETKVENAAPKASIQKTIEGTGSAEHGMYKVGENIHYKIVVKNIGNTTLSNVKVKDTMSNASGKISNIKLNGTEASIWDEGETTFTIPTIVQNAEAIITYDYQVQPDDRKDEKIDNTASVENINDVTVIGNPPSADVENQSLAVTKTVENKLPEGQSYDRDATIKFVVTVKNNGNVSLSNIKVTDAMQNAAGKATFDSDRTKRDNPTVTINENDTEIELAGLAVAQEVKLYYTYQVRPEDIGNTNIVTNKVTVDPADTILDPSVDPKVEKETDPLPIADRAPKYTIKKSVESQGSLENGKVYAVGDPIEYKIEIKNEGNVALGIGEVKIKDIMEGVSGPIEDINGAKWDAATTTFTNDAVIPLDGTRTITYKYQVKKEDIGNTIKNTAISGEQTTSDNPITIENRKLEVEKSVDDSPENGFAYALDEEITFKVKVTNTGNVALKDVIVSDKMWRSELNSNVEVSASGRATTTDKETFDLAVDESKELTYSYSVQEGDLESKLINEASATAADNTTDKDRAEAVATEKRDPKVSVEKTITSNPTTENGMYKENDIITYQIAVKNEGNTTLTDVKVTDIMTGASQKIMATSVKGAKSYSSTVTEQGREYTFTIAKIEVGETRNITYSYKVTKDDIGATIGNAAVVGEIPNKENPVNPDPVVIENKKLEVSKEVVNGPADGKAYKLGETIRFKITVRNAGNVALTGIKLTDEMVGAAGNATVGTGSNTLSIGELPVGDVSETYWSYTVQEQDLKFPGDADAIKNTVTAIASDGTEGYGETEYLKIGEQNPDFTVSKENVGTGSAEDGKYAVGETIHYVITVTNTGNVTLRNIVVKDNMSGAAGSISNVQGATWNERAGHFVVGTPIAPEGQTATITYDYVVQPEDAGKTIRNTATGHGLQQSVNEVVIENRELSVEKFVESTPANGTGYVMGEEIRFGITVRNTGNVSLSDIGVEDQMQNAAGQAVAEAGDTIEQLKAGEYATLYYTYTVQREDIGKTGISNMATASSGDTTGTDQTREIPMDRLYTLTIYYVYADGTVASATVSRELAAGEDFGTIYSPAIDGYTANYAFIRSGANGMPAQDLTYTVTYTANPTTPTPTPTTTTPTPPTPPTPPVTVIPTPAGPATVPTPVLIGDEEVPLGGEVTVDDDGNVTIVPVEDEEVPLARDIDDHDCCALHFLLTLAAFIIYLFFTKSMKKRQAKINELRDQYETEVLKRKLGIADNDKDRTV